MCIEVREKQAVKNGEMKLWKVVRKDDQVGLWNETGWEDYKLVTRFYRLGVNSPSAYHLFNSKQNGRFHCFFTRKAARKYIEFRNDERRFPFYRNRNRHPLKAPKIIRVYAHSSDVLEVGVDSLSGIPSVSVSKMEIKSLKHQR